MRNQAFLGLEFLVVIGSFHPSASGHAFERKAPPSDRAIAFHGAPPGSVPDGGGASGAPSTRNAWPCLLVVDEDLRPFADLAWDRSATFRDQCRTLGAAQATVIVRSASSRDLHAATARIELTGRGTVFARIRVRVRHGANIVELIAHELEHVLERVEGLNLLMESRRGGSSVTLLSGGAFESERAIDAGRRVAREVQQATRELRTRDKAGPPFCDQLVDSPLVAGLSPEQQSRHVARAGAGRPVRRRRLVANPPCRSAARCRDDRLPLRRDAVPARRNRVNLRRVIEDAGGRATADAPLAWLSMEPGPDQAEVHVTMWPGGERRLIAQAGFHGRDVKVL